MADNRKARNFAAAESVQAQRALAALRLDAEYWKHLKTVGYYPHEGQKQILKILLGGGVKQLFLQCSRNFGKSSLIGLDAILHCGRYPKSKYYIIAPYRTQAFEIYWASSFLEQLIPPGWLAKTETPINKTELRISFANGSYVKLDGADNEAAVRGYKPTRLACDEFQDWRKETWQAMEPNLLPYNATVIKVGTPPDRPGLYTEQADFTKRRMLENSSKFLWLQRTIYDNPRIPLDQLEDLRKGFIERGEETIWRREYLAEYIPGGAAALLPQFSEAENMRPMEWIQARIARDRHKLEYYTVFDPSGSRFGVGLYGYNRYESEAYQFAEIVETDRQKLSVAQLWPRVAELERQHFPKEPFRIYDEAASLFAVEMENLGVSLAPTQKKQNEKSNNISLFRDALVKRKFWIADHCVKTKEDIYNFHTNDSGRIVKEKDEMVDTALYFLAESGYSFNTSPINVEFTGQRFFTPATERTTPLDEQSWIPTGASEMDDVNIEDFLWNS